MEYQSENRICQNCKQDFTIEPEDFSFYEKIKVPPPTFCPECRMVRRFNFRNEGILFRRKDAHNGKEVFSGYSDEAPVTTYDNSYWYSTDWDPHKTAMDFDFSKTFFEQFKTLLAQAPIPARSCVNLVNSDYCNEVSEAKNSYLCFNSDYLENCAYLRTTNHIKESVDLFQCRESEMCYEGVTLDKCFKTLFSLDCENCVDVWFSRGLRGCTNCFGCVNLANKSYCYFNEQYSKEEYMSLMQNFNSQSRQEVTAMKQKAQDFWIQFPVKFNHSLRTINSTGEKIYDTKNVRDSYLVKNCENLRYCQDMQYNANNCYDYSVWGDGAENVYECITCGLGIYNLRFCFNCWDEARNLEYCGYCLGSQDCFGCVGLYKKRYCILNKQYAKEDYFALRQRIINQMESVPFIDKKGRIYRYGEFFPQELAINTYNESVAQDFFPLSQTSAEEKGYIWREPVSKNFEVTLDTSELPDIGLADEILNEVIRCKECRKAYRISNVELQFYKKVLLPIPAACHKCRFIARFGLVNPPRLWRGRCMCNNENHTNHADTCTVEFETSFAPGRPEIVYCERCYQQEVY